MGESHVVKTIRTILLYVGVAVVVFLGVKVIGNFNEISEAVRQFRERKPAFSGSSFDGWRPRKS
jgi:hypothetical protein